MIFSIDALSCFCFSTITASSSEKLVQSNGVGGDEGEEVGATELVGDDDDDGLKVGKYVGCDEGE